MAELKYIPAGKLSSYVELIWFSDNYKPVTPKERVLPNGSSQLIINLEDLNFCHFSGVDDNIKKEYDPVIITGIHTSNIFLDSFSRISTMGAVLLPGAVPALFDIPAHELKNKVISLEDFMGSSILAFRQRLIQAATPEDKFYLLESFLANRINHSFQTNPAVIFSVSQINNKNGIPPIAEIRDKFGYSRRRFSQIFKELVGITPKKYARICRFQHCLKLMKNNNILNCADLAIRCGYYDQSHFIHDFKKLSGITPTEYYKNQNDAINHLPILNSK